MVIDMVKDTVNDTQYRILELLADNPRITAIVISAKIGINERSVRKNIKVLKDAGLIERIGSAKTGQWVVKTTNRKK